MAKVLAYAKSVIDRRQSGARIGLLVVAVSDWEAGKWFESRPEVCRVLLTEEVAVDAADWSISLALDCVVCGHADDARFYSVCNALRRAGAASIWGEFDDGIWLLEPVGKRWLAVEGPYHLGRLGAALRSHREVMMMLRKGFYGSRIFDGARQAILQSLKKVAA